VRAYFAMVNGQGGVDGRKLKLTALDDQYTPPVAVQQTRKLISQELAEVAVNGSATTKAVLNILGPQGIPVIGPQTGATYLFQNTPRVLFNVWPEYTIEGKLLGSFAQRRGLKKVGVLYQNDDFGQSLYKGVLASGLKPAKVITYDPTQTDFSPQAQQFKSAGVDGVIILAIPKPTIAFLNAMAALNFKPVRMMSQVSAIPQSFSASPAEFPGSYIGAFILPLQSSDNPQVSQFKQAMHQYEPGAPVSIFAASEIAVAVKATEVAVWATLVGSVGSGWICSAAICVSDRNAWANDVSGRSVGRSSASGRDGAYCAKNGDWRTSGLMSGDRSTPIIMRLSQSPSSKPCVKPVLREKCMMPRWKRW